MSSDRDGAYLSDIAANLAHSGQEFQCSHPFFRTQSCFPSKVVKVRDQPVEDVSETSIWTLGIDTNGVLGDVVNSQVLHWGHLGF